GVVLPGPLTFEWIGGELSGQTIRIAGPSGVILERRDVAGGRFVYPAADLPLTASSRYQLQVTDGAGSWAAAWFEVVSPAQAELASRELAELEAAVGSTASLNTATIVQVGYLLNQGLFMDAQAKLSAAVTAHPEDAAFRALLRSLYEELGLSRQVADSL